MWITTTTIDMLAYRLDPQKENSVAVLQKKIVLQAADGNGKSLDGFAPPESNSFDDISPDVDTHVIKRAWNTELAAQEFADFLNTNLNWSTSVVEEQV